MPSIEALFSVAIAGLFLSATPGPSMLYVLSRSVGQSRAAGLASAIGLCLGGIILAVATAMGLATLFARFEWIVTGLRWAGSVYLVWLGIGMIREARVSATMPIDVHSVEKRSFLTIVWQGVGVELLNPKTVLFFALFLPPFVDASVSGSVQSQLLILGILVPLTAIPSDLLVAWMGGTMSQVVNRQHRVRTALSWAGGLVLIVIAGNLQLGYL
ncbi:LysE family translocator [Loktanella sp. SALINAS62]|uniref:LysE family translocator n=1 Tax=Loktanella sp. SALINAS62 TaxID=2706124 RepID=UPI001B8D114E|nr:LysE family translocator [Loktanella sp. SALINAS62]MBS1300768.1 LysE family translocator [Loktanella sp. SALINAS62]